MKKLFFLFLLISVAVFAQTDSTITTEPSGIFGLSWLTVAGILTGAEILLRVLPIPAKYSILSAIGWLIKAIPNNTPKPQ